MTIQGSGSEEAHLPEDGMLWPFWKRRVPVGGPQEAHVLELVGAGPGLALGAPGRPLSASRILS